MHAFSLKKILCSFIFFFVSGFAEDLKYTHFVDEYFSIHVVEFDPKKFEILPILGLDECLGKEKLSSIAKRYNASLAINGGFFKITDEIDDGLPDGILKIENEWISLPKKPRAALGWDKNFNTILLDRLLTNAILLLDGEEFLLDGINCVKKGNQRIVYFPIFHKTTLTSLNTLEFTVIDNQVAKISHGSSKIPEEGFIISVDKTDPIIDKILNSKHIDTKIFILPSNNSSWDNIDYIIGGTPLLIKNGEIITDFSIEAVQSSFIIKKHARSAIGIKPNGNWLFVVVDVSTGGMTLNELAKFLKGLARVYKLFENPNVSYSLLANNNT
ncbi:MAG: phosphodiester glycosidase family protein [Chlamydiae bacterium]|nr:phosphodiester glycosidase family protein [Chlamydiota bacterium]